MRITVVAALLCVTAVSMATMLSTSSSSSMVLDEADDDDWPRPRQGAVAEEEREEPQRAALPFELPLKPGVSRLTWDFSLHRNRILFRLELPPDTSVLGLGFSDRGQLPGADFGIVELVSVKPKVADFKVNSAKGLSLLPSSEYQLDGWDVTGGALVVRLSRSILPKDPGMYTIDRGTTHLLFFASPSVWDRLADYDVSTHLVQLIKSRLPIPPLRADDAIEALEVRVADVHLPAAETTYWCRVVPLPPMPEPRHIVGYEPVITKGNEGLVHHLEVFLCVEDLPPSVLDYDAPCNSETKPLGMTSCRKVIGAWAMGASGIFYPSEAGLPIGGTQRRQYAVIELHYNNPQGRAGLVDSSGLRFYVTPRLRRYDVGIMELGLDYLPNAAIPPGQPAFQLTGYCLPQCTEAGLPQDGIRIFASQLHTHSTGARVRTLHRRAGRFVRTLNDDRHYSPHFQEIRLLPRTVRVLPGDTLTTSCTFDTSKRTNVTIGGLAISNEMCLNYVFYYPRSRLELCKSVPSVDALSGFFRKMKLLYGANTSPLKSIAENYGSIAWGRMEVEALGHFYRTGRVHQSCNSSAGAEIPGHNWDNLNPAVKPA